MTHSVPQCDPKANYLAHKEAIDAAVRAVLESGWYILGKEVTAFEAEFAAYVGVTHGVGVGSGTDALLLALRACAIGPGDGVITVSHTAVATVAAIEMAGATPILVDIDDERFTLDPALLEEAIRSWRGRGVDVKAVIPVHLYGHPAPMARIVEIARRHNLWVIEDCAQAHGAWIDGRRAGAWGDLAAFSFYPTKNLGALGDGGILVTGDDGLAARARQIRQYGWQQRYISEVPGINTRLDEVQAAILRVKLAALDAENERRRRIAARYDQELTVALLRLPTVHGNVTHVYHQYVVRSPERDSLAAHLRSQGIGTLVHYPQPVHCQPAYRDRIAVHGDLPHSEAAAAQVLSLPIFPEMTDADVDAVVSAVHAWVAQPADAAEQAA
ncbi:aminotransferase class I/II-fold pyridoxal phosphate-dependent enzyme [bacterium]|nr:aminotransferase class I/II-fold pyridoxal phosphate-dependent enzyme [bacterium]